MKIHWGHGITIAIALCMIAILSLVFITSKEKIDLVTEEYYPKELIYEQQLVKLRNTENLAEKIFITTSGSITVQFPDLGSLNDSIRGEILFYRPSDKMLDKQIKIKPDSNLQMVFDRRMFNNGKYEVIIDWSDSRKLYLQKETIYL